MLGSNRLGLVGLDPTVPHLAVRQRSGGNWNPTLALPQVLRKAPDPAGLNFVGAKLDDPRPRSTLNSLSATVSACASCTFETDRAIRGAACRRPLHRRLLESEKPTVSPQRSPETLGTRRPAISPTSLIGVFSALALAALLHDLRILGL